MPIDDHASFDRPDEPETLWRYTDLAKFLDLLTSERLWLSNAEVLAADDPYEGRPGAIQFPHRMWKRIDEVPEPMRGRIVSHFRCYGDVTPEAAFRSWMMLEEQSCIMNQACRRNFYVNWWHNAPHESVAM